jgi:hypothetical protein
MVVPTKSVAPDNNHHSDIRLAANVTCMSRFNGIFTMLSPVIIVHIACQSKINIIDKKCFPFASWIQLLLYLLALFLKELQIRHL